VSLTGSVFLDLVAVCTVAFLVGLIIFWQALSGRSVGKILARTGMLLTVNFLVLVTAATQLNAQYQWFADWTDLRGAFFGAPRGTALSRGATASHASSGKVVGASAIAGHVLPPLPLGRMSQNGVISYTVKGPLSGITATVVVQIPPNYTSSRNATVRYPVLETFPAIPGDTRIWIDTMNLGGVVAQEVAARRIAPVLIVSPQVEIPSGVDTECVNGSPGNPQVETWLTRDVPNWVTNTFRVKTDRTSWATIGLSAGGWCAAMATMLHPAQYSAAIIMGGYFHPDFGPVYYPYPPNSKIPNQYDLVALAQRTPPPVALWMETSHADTLSYGTSAAVIKAARPPMSVDATVLQHAGHRLTVWEPLVPLSLDWLGANVRGFKPTP
jgi:hypothetical protein